MRLLDLNTYIYNHVTKHVSLSAYLACQLISNLLDILLSFLSVHFLIAEFINTLSAVH